MDRSVEAAREMIRYLQEQWMLSGLLAFVGWSLVSFLIGLTRKKANVPRFYYREASFLDRLLDPFRMLLHAKEATLQGYAKFPRSFFKLSLLNYPSGVIVIDRAHLKEFFDAPNSKLNFFEAALEDLDFRYTFTGNSYNLYHVHVVRNQLTRGIQAFMPAIGEEIKGAFEDDIDPLLNGNGEWTSIPLYKKTMKIVARTSYRAFIGRNPEFLEAAVTNARSVAEVESIVVKFFWRLHCSQRICHKYMAPIVEEHKRMMEQNQGKDYKKPADMIQWLLEAAEGVEKETDQLVSRILMVNFAAIHTTSMSFTHAVYDLVANPQFIQPLRDEIEPLLAEYGWEKSTFMKMKKLDSFVKETLRLNMVSGVGTFRKVVEPFKFSNGVTVHPGETLASPVGAIHFDNSVYDDATTFNAFRFSKMREMDGESAKVHSVNTGTEFLTFGHGEHAWYSQFLESGNVSPGRFFAVSELKAMLAYVLLNYDMMVPDGKRPKNWEIGIRSLPNMNANVMFRFR